MKLLRPLIAVLTPFLILALICPPSLAGDASLQQQLAELAKRVAELEQQIDELNGKNNWKDPVYWQRLKIEMSAADVIKLLGKPARIDEQIFTTWYYHQTSKLHSYIWFDEGKVLGWELPD